MKKIILILLIIGGVVWAMDNREQVEGYANRAKAWFEQTVLKKEPASESDEVAVTESKTPSETTKPATPPPSTQATAVLTTDQETLPEGYYYTRERVSKVTDTGVAGIAKGVKVQKVGEQNGDYLVTDGTVEIAAASAQLTRDAAEIAVLTAPIVVAKPTVKKDSSASEAVKPVRTGPHPEIPGLTTRLQALDEKLRTLNLELRELENERDLAKLRGRVSSSHIYIDRVKGQIDHASAQRRSVAARLDEIK